MDADRFDVLARSLMTSSRRGLSRALAGLGLVGGLGRLLEVMDAQAKKKGKKGKKKCKKSQKKCGKKCIPKDGCCPTCSSRESCSFGFCICASGTTTCGEFCCVSGAEICVAPSGAPRYCLPAN